MLVLAAIVLIAGATLCLFDSDDGAASTVDLCLLVIAVVGMPYLAGPGALSGRLVPLPFAASDLTSFEPVAPPPRA